MSESSNKGAAGAAEPQPLIFLVDDTPGVNEMVELFLNAVGYRTRSFEDPRLALEALKTADPKPALMVTDFQMPGMNGMELIQRSKAIHPQLKTISASGTMTQEILRTYPIKPDLILPKPFFPDQLVLAAKNVLSAP